MTSRDPFGLLTVDTGEFVQRRWTQRLVETGKARGDGSGGRRGRRVQRLRGWK